MDSSHFERQAEMRTGENSQSVSWPRSWPHSWPRRIRSIMTREPHERYTSLTSPLACFSLSAIGAIILSKKEFYIQNRQ